MVRNKQGKAPSKRISDELYSTPIVVKKQNNVTKKKREVSNINLFCAVSICANFSAVRYIFLDKKVRYEKFATLQIFL